MMHTRAACSASLEFVKGIVMFIQIKAIRKGTKPPIWRRAYVPMGITFAQLAYIMEILLELPVTAAYEFEFFQEMDRLIEGDNREKLKTDYRFRYRNAVKASVNDRVKPKAWFTFRLNRGGEDLPQYRVELEKLSDVKIRDENKPLDYPMITIQKSPEEDRYWTAPNDINQKLKDTCFLSEGEADYPSFESVRDQIEQGKGITVCQNIESKDNIISDSGLDMMQAFADRINQLQVRIDELQREIGARMADEDQSGKSRQDPAVSKSDSIRNPSSLLGAKRTNPRKIRSVEEVLKAYPKEELIEMAEEYGIKLHSSSKAKMAYELARGILEPGFMREQLLELDEEELDAFEGMIRKGRHLPDDDEADKLEGFLFLDYVAELTNGQFEVPEDVATVYGIICRSGYREFHKKAKWLLNCLRVFSTLYAVGRVDLLYKLYCQTSLFKTDREEFDDILAKIPDRLNECCKIGSRIVAKEAAEDQIYLKLEERQRKVPYYIPSESEILDYAVNRYPASDPVYRRLYDFFEKDMGVEEPDCWKYCVMAYITFSASGALSDYMEFLSEQRLVFKSEGQAARFANLIMELNNNTRKYLMKGHTPLEMRAYAPPAKPGERTKILPMSSDAAKLLEEGRKQLQIMGFDVETNETGTVIPMMSFNNGVSGDMKSGSRKIYPNDPCPCGSGKKFKKCCGRNM